MRQEDIYGFYEPFENNLTPEERDYYAQTYKHKHSPTLMEGARLSFRQSFLNDIKLDYILDRDSYIGRNLRASEPVQSFLGLGSLLDPGGIGEKVLEDMVGDEVFGDKILDPETANKLFPTEMGFKEPVRASYALTVSQKYLENKTIAELLTNYRYDGVRFISTLAGGVVAPSNLITSVAITGTLGTIGLTYKAAKVGKFGISGIKVAKQINNINKAVKNIRGVKTITTPLRTPFGNSVAREVVGGLPFSYLDLKAYEKGGQAFTQEDFGFNLLADAGIGLILGVPSLFKPKGKIKKRISQVESTHNTNSDLMNTKDIHETTELIAQEEIAASKGKKSKIDFQKKKKDQAINDIKQKRKPVEQKFAPVIKKKQKKSDKVFISPTESNFKVHILGDSPDYSPEYSNTHGMERPVSSYTFDFTTDKEVLNTLGDMNQNTHYVHEATLDPQANYMDTGSKLNSSDRAAIYKIIERKFEEANIKNDIDGVEINSIKEAIDLVEALDRIPDGDVEYSASKEFLKYIHEKYGADAVVTRHDDGHYDIGVLNKDKIKNVDSTEVRLENKKVANTINGEYQTLIESKEGNVDYDPELEAAVDDVLDGKDDESLKQLKEENKNEINATDNLDEMEAKIDQQIESGELDSNIDGVRDSIKRYHKTQSMANKFDQFIDDFIESLTNCKL